MGNGTQQSGGPGRGPSFNQASVLVVDYDRLAARFVRIALAADGYDVSICSNGEDAVGRVTTGGYALVIYRAGMPRLDGRTFLALVRRRARLTKYVITETDAVTAHECRVLGAHDVWERLPAYGALCARTSHLLLTEQRDAVRFGASSPVCLGDVPGLLVDIGAGGAYVCTRHRFREGALTGIRIHFPGTADPVELTGSVVRTRQAGGFSYVALRFCTYAGDMLLPFAGALAPIRAVVHKKVPYSGRMTYILPGIVA